MDFPQKSEEFTNEHSICIATARQTFIKKKYPSTMKHYTWNVVKKKFMNDPYKLVDDGIELLTLSK